MAQTKLSRFSLVWNLQQSRHLAMWLTTVLIEAFFFFINFWNRCMSLKNPAICIVTKMSETSRDFAAINPQANIALKSTLADAHVRSKSATRAQQTEMRFKKCSTNYTKLKMNRPWTRSLEMPGAFMAKASKNWQWRSQNYLICLNCVFQFRQLSSVVFLFAFFNSFFL